MRWKAGGGEEEVKWSAVSEKARQEPLHQIDEDECGEEDQDRGMIILIMG